MKLIRNILYSVLLMVALNACFETPTYPVVPQIEILNDELYYGKSSTGDSLVVVLKFKDGDGDMGLSDDDQNTFKFGNRYYYDLGDNDFKLDYEDVNQALTYKIRRTNPTLNINIDPLAITENFQPISNYDFVTPYNCTRWEVIRGSNNIVKDTVFVFYNPNYYNIYIDFYTKNTDGSYTLFDPTIIFKYPNCSIAGYNGRFPILSKDLGKKSPLDGKITYALKGGAFEDQFGSKTMQLKITIQDRALNKSNVITTKDFTLASIRK
ncbi:MAG: hypothetical protein HOP30_13110 [Cyclobacteriaceae bacterium]|nr:hypothetical protein [Cyclobacteriaceae bacterium]